MTRQELPPFHESITGLDCGIISTSSGNFFVRASLFSLQGKKLGSFESRGPGASRELNAMFQRQAAGLYLVEVSAGSATSAKVMYSRIGARSPIRIAEISRGTKSLARQAAAGYYVLSASAPGYVDRAVLQSQSVASGIIIVLPSRTGDSSSAQLGAASAFLMNDTLTVSTGRVMRSWKWTGHGFATISLVNLQSGRQWVQKALPVMADWSFHNLIDNTSLAQLIKVASKAVTKHPLRSASGIPSLFTRLVMVFTNSRDEANMKILPWYPQKKAESFTDARASLRKTLWRQRIIATTGITSVPSKTLTALIDVVAAEA